MAHVTKIRDYYGHSEDIKCVALGCNSSKLMASGSADNTVKVWSIDKSDYILSFPDCERQVKAVTFGNGEVIVAGGTSAGVIKIWDLESTKVTHSYAEHKSAVHSIAFNSGAIAATASSDHTIKIWDLLQRKCANTMEGHEGGVTCVSFSPDGRWLASSDDIGVTKLWDFIAGKELHEFKAHCSSIKALCFSPKHKVLASGFVDGSVIFLDLEKMKLIGSSKDHNHPVCSVRFCPDRRCLYCMSAKELNVIRYDNMKICHNLSIEPYSNTIDMNIYVNQLIGAHCNGATITTFSVDITGFPDIDFDEVNRPIVEWEWTEKSLHGADASMMEEVDELAMLSSEEDEMYNNMKLEKTGPLTGTLFKNLPVKFTLEKDLSDSVGNLPPFFHVAGYNGEDPGILPEDHEEVSASLLMAIKIRSAYMAMSGQNFSTSISSLLEILGNKGAILIEDGAKLLEESRIKYTAKAKSTAVDERNPFAIEVPGKSGYLFRMVDGIMRVYTNSVTLKDGNAIDWQYPKCCEYIDQQEALVRIVRNRQLKAVCSRRLAYLLAKYKLHLLMNHTREINAQKDIPHKDFYNVYKVDNHVHAAAAFNQKHLLSFIKKTVKNNPNHVVYRSSDKTAKAVTLAKAFEDMKLSPYDVTIDSLDVRCDKSNFGRFSRFNMRFNPFRQSRLREIFLKTDNYRSGEYFAALLKEVTHDLEQDKYKSAEYRLSIYGKSRDEWGKLALWFVSNRMHSNNVRWMIQIPRLYDVYKQKNEIQNFQQLLENIFVPLFDATINPKQHENIHIFLSMVSGFDSVDDESKAEGHPINKYSPTPEHWTQDENPPYSYFSFYMFANLVMLNNLRRQRGMNTFSYRPHCGESGSLHHLITGFMCGESIAHGIQLRKSSVLQYLYFLTQIGIATSPLSNHYLFLNYAQHPLSDLHAKGLLMALSTDDPLQFHITKDPLMEEFSNASHNWRLSNIDMCELARNSVLISRFKKETKMKWLGDGFECDGIRGNTEVKTDVPDIRVQFRYEALIEELMLVFHAKSAETDQDSDDAPPKKKSKDDELMGMIADMMNVVEEPFRGSLQEKARHLKTQEIP